LAQPPMQPPMYQPMPPPQHRPVSEYFRPLASDFLMAIVVVVGLFLMMLGSIIAGLFGGDAEAFGLVIRSFGVFVLTVILLFGALMRPDMDKMVRFGLILASAAIIIWANFWVSYL